MKEYSESWSRILDGMSEGELTDTTGDMMHYLNLMPIVETENYYYILSFNPLPAPNNENQGIACVEKRTGKIKTAKRTRFIDDRGEVKVLRRNYPFLVLGDDLVFYDHRNRTNAIGAGGVSVFYITPQLDLIVSVARFTNPFMDLPINLSGTVENDSAVSYSEDGSLVINGSRTVTRFNSTTFEIAGHTATITVSPNGVKNEEIVKNLYYKETFEPGFLDAEKRRDSHLILAKKICHGSKIRIWNDSLYFLGEIHGKVCQSKADLKSKPFSTVTIPGYGKKTVENPLEVYGSTLLTNKPRSKEHQEVRGKFGMLIGKGVFGLASNAEPILYAVDYKGGLTEIKINNNYVGDTDYLSVIFGIDNKNNVYSYYGGGADNRTQRLRKVNSSGDLIWEFEPVIKDNHDNLETELIFHFRFAENQKIIYLMTSQRNTTPSTSKRFYCIDAETGEVIWEYRDLIDSVNHSYRPYSKQQPDRLLKHAYLLLDLEDEETGTLQPYLLANTDSKKTSAEEFKNFELVRFDMELIKTCERIPALPKYLAKM